MDPYKILGIEKGASPEEIRRAYRSKAAKFHPDRDGEAWIFQQINDAYEELTGKRKTKQKSATDSPKPEKHEPTGADDFDIDAPFGNDPFEFDIPNPEPYYSTYSPPNPRAKKKSAAKYKWILMAGGGGMLSIVLLLFVFWPSLTRSSQTELAANEQPQGFDKNIYDAAQSKTVNKQGPISKEIAGENSAFGDANTPVRNDDSRDESRAPDLIRLPTSPVLLLTFDNTGASVAGPNVEEFGAYKSQGVVGNGLVISEGAYAKTSNNFPIGDASRTLAVWLKSNRSFVSQNVHVVNYGQPNPNEAFGIMIASNKWRFFDWGGGLDTGKVIDSEWHHHCITYDGKEMIYHFDGELVAKVSRRLQTKRGPLFLGLLEQGYAHGFEGVVDELVVYSSALSSSQIEKLVALGREGKHPDETLSSRPFAATDPTGSNNFSSRSSPSRDSIDRREVEAKDSSPEIVHRLVGKQLKIVFDRVEYDVLLNQNGTWSARTWLTSKPAQVTPISGRWESKENTIVAYESSRADAANGIGDNDIYNIYSIKVGKLQAEHFYARKKVNEGEVVITDGNIRPSRPGRPKIGRPNTTPK